MGKLKYLFFVLLGALFFICPQKAEAAEPPKVVINEVYSHPDTDQIEWIELFNTNRQSLSLSGYTIEDGTAKPINLDSYQIPTGGYLVLYQGTDLSFGLNDPGDLIKLKNNGIETDRVAYGNWPDGDLSDNAPAPPKGQSIARIPNGHDSDNDAADFIVQTKSTPGAGIPQAVTLENPELVDNFVDLAWSKVEEDDFLKYEIYLSENKNELGDRLDVINGQEENFYEIKDLIPGLTYYFVIRNYNIAGIYNDSNQASIFLPKIYPKTIIINEILPHPQNGSDYEFIELYNSGVEEVDISGWYLDDVDGGSTPYEIPLGTKPISPGGYLFFYKTQTKISLNDDGDSARLLFPDMQAASSCWPYDEYAPVGVAWARTASGGWAWTTTLTPGDPNIFTSEIIEAAGGDDEEIKIPINDEPVEIKTGDIENYRDYLVTVSGEITRTSGNTFYLDDGSGEIKVYIQEKTDIDKPPMHQGDVFEITGIVNIYRNTWRLLPQKQDDIKLIQAKDIEKSSTTAKTSTAKKSSSSSKSTSSNSNARAPTAIKQVKAAENQNDTPGVPTEQSSSFWINFLKMLVGLAIILLIIFVLKMRSIKKDKPLGADFGDDLT